MKQVDDLSVFWTTFLAATAEQMTTGQFSTWFARTRCLAASEEEIVIGVETDFTASWLSRTYRDSILERAENLLGWRAQKISFRVDRSLQSTEAAEDQVSEMVLEAGAGGSNATRPAPSTADRGPANVNPSSPVPVTPTRSGIGAPSLNPAYTFDNFVVGPSNRLSHAAALAVVDGVGRTYNPLFIHGKLGLGKTHLLQGICHQLLQRNPNTKMLYIPCEVFINAFISALGKNRVEAFRDRYRQLDVLVIDDIHFLANKDHTQEEFFHTFNALYNDQKQIILSADCPPKDIPQLEERLVSRFKWGMVCEIEKPTYETRLAIIRKKAQYEVAECGGDLPDIEDEVAEYLADSMRGSIRELEGAVTRLVGYANIMKQPLTMETAKVALEDLIEFGTKRVSIEQIIEHVTDHFGVRLSDLQSKKRFQSITQPRQICMYLIRELTNLSLSEIGGYFGGRDHSTVIYGCDRVRKKIETDPQYRSLLDGFVRQLTDG
jgi:chromosomal replication initiator protein